jgi:hypothetical protein
MQHVPAGPDSARAVKPRPAKLQPLIPAPIRTSRRFTPERLTRSAIRANKNPPMYQKKRYCDFQAASPCSACGYQMGKISFASILLGLEGSLLRSQIGTEGAFFGTVTDSSGSSVPGAEVAATHLGTGLSKPSVADVQGYFSILAFPIGPYSVTVKAKGFKTWEVTAAELTVGDRTRLAPILNVGDISESVSTSANAELLQTETSSANRCPDEANPGTASRHTPPAGTGIARARHAVCQHR